MAQLIAGILLLGFWLTLIGGYITNIIYLIKAESFIATNEALVATIGVFLPPLGIIHGIYTWF
jgi:hypothetical protein